MTPKRARTDTIGRIGRIAARVPARRQATAVSPQPPHRPAVRGGLLKNWRLHLRRAFTENLGFKFLSMVLALTVFLLVNTDRDREITALVGVSYRVPDDRVLVSPRLDSVKVTVRGPWRRLRQFDDREIERLDLDLSHAQSGEIAITPDMVHLPSGLTLTSISPRTLRVAFEKRAQKTVDVVAATAGRPQHGFVATEVSVEPRTIRIRGAEGVLAAMSTLRTAEVRVDGRSENFSAEVPLAVPDGVEVDPNGSVAVHVAIEEQLVTRHIGKLPIAIHADGIDIAKLTPSTTETDVVLTGTVRAVERAIAHGIKPAVHVSASDAARDKQETITMEGMPSSIGVELNPPKIDVRVKR